MIQTAEGHYVLENDLASRFIAESHRLDYDRSVEQVLPYLEPGDAAIDVGAMLGAYAGPMKEKVGSQGRVLAFEPCPESGECLVKNCPDVEIWHCGLSDRMEEGKLRRVAGNMGTSHMSLAEEVDGGEFRVMLYPLDQVLSYCEPLKRLKLIKIDAEGYESKILAGAKETILKFCPAIYLEINHGYLDYYGLGVKDVIGPMVELGYRVKFLSDQHSFDREKLPQLDIFLLPC